MIFSTAAALTVGLGLTPGLSAANLITNGSFTSSLSGWTLVKTNIVEGQPTFARRSFAHCVPSQNGNGHMALDAPNGSAGYFEQAVEMTGDGVLSLRTFGEFSPVTVRVEIIDESNVAHLLEQYVPPLTIAQTHPSISCAAVGPIVKSWPVTGYDGQTIKVRISGSSGGEDGAFALWDDIELEVEDEDQLTAGILVDPAEVAIDEEFTLTVRARNAGTTDLVDVAPQGSVQATSEDGGTVQVLSGPTPASAATIEAGAFTDFVYQMKATHEGTVTLVVEIAGENENGDPVEGEAICVVPSGVTTSTSRSGTAIAAPAEGCGNVVTIEPPCKIELVDESPPIFVARSTNRTIQVGADTPLACGGPTCKAPKPTQEVTRVAEVDIAKLTSAARQTTKNVGQEVKLKAKVKLKEGLALETLGWTVEGKTIPSYTGVSGYTAGQPLALSFSPEPVMDPLEKTTEPDQEHYDTLVFFWKDTGTFTVEVEATAKDENDVEVKCDVDEEFEVERNATDPERQPEDFFTSCCADSPERVRREHETWHARVDATVPHAGDDWLNFHRAVVRVYSQWREFFGYPELPHYDGSGPFAASEAGFDTTDETRIADTPRCAAAADPRDGLQHPLQSACPMPSWFLGAGGAGARPLVPNVDGFFEDGPGSPFIYFPQCFRARNYDGDLCWVARLGDGQQVDTVTCGAPAGLQGPVSGVPTEFEVKSDNRVVDLAAVGQTRLADFKDNVELGCIVTKSWHLQMHQLFGGAMMATSTSPKDPVFYRIHQLLSGVTKPGAPITIYDFWESEASGSGTAPLRGPSGGSGSFQTDAAVVDSIAPELTQRFPYPQYPIAKLDAVAVAFWEEVSGVDPSDLEVDGQPATAVTGSGKGPYVFSGFPPVGPFASAVGGAGAAASRHGGHGHARAVVAAVGGATPTIVLEAGGIQDTSGNAFTGDSWTVPVEPDGDDDGVADSVDNCPDVPNPLQENSDMYHVHVEGSAGPDDEHAGMIFGDELGDACDTDDDDDGFSDAAEEQHGSDPQARTSVPDPDELPGDTDGDGTSNAADACFTDPLKTTPGVCGCGAPDRDSDGDGTLDCQDLCPLDRLKTEPGDCGCAFDEVSGENGLACVESITQAPEPVQEIPTLSRWGVVLIVLLLGGAALRAIRPAP